MSLVEPTNTRRGVRRRSEKTPHSSAIGSGKTLTIQEPGVLFSFGKIVKPTERWEVRGKEVLDKRTESSIGQKRSTRTRPHPNFIMQGSLELYEASELPYSEKVTALGEEFRET